MSRSLVGLGAEEGMERQVLPSQRQRPANAIPSRDCVAAGKGGHHEAFGFSVLLALPMMVAVAPSALMVRRWPGKE